MKNYFEKRQFWTRWICLFLCLAPVLASAQEHVPILSPAFKDQKTEKLELENGLKVYMISDPNAEKSAAALAVNAGSWEEPDQNPGLAHFLEHMLFLGTKKYPNESEYQKFIEANGGRTNAFTQALYTTYLFEVGTPAYSEALDRFSQFFKEPLFNQSGVDREMHAVNNEFAALVEKNDARRIMVFQALANPKHPDHRFSAGNLSSLKNTTSKELKDWFNTHYSSNLMTLILYSPLPLDTLKQYAVEYFSDIPDKDFPITNFEEPILSPSMKGKIAYIEPVEHQNILTLTWVLPKEIVEARDSQPEEIVCNILGYEGANSLAAELKEQGLSSSLACGTHQASYDEIFLFLQIELTNKGADQLYHVIQTIFEAIASYKKDGIPQYLFNDIHDMQVLKFQYPSRQDAFKEVEKNAVKLQFEDLAGFPEEEDIIQKFNPELIEKTLNMLSPENAYIDFMAPQDMLKFKLDKKEPWMNIPYTVKEVPEKIFQEWVSAKPNPNISIPSENPWITRNLLPPTTEFEKEFPHPTLLISDKMGQFFFAKDSIYLIPETFFSLDIKTPKLEAGKALQATQAELHLQIIEESLKKISYDAYIAGLEFGLKRTEEGILLQFQGYTEKLPQFIEDLISQLNSFRPSAEMFYLAKECLLRQYQNSARKNTINLAIQDFRDILYDKYITDLEKLQVIDQITYEDFLTFFEHFYEQIYLKGIAYGSLESSQAKLLWSKILDIFSSSPYPKGKDQTPKMLVLPQNKGPFFTERVVKNRGNALLLVIEQYPFSFQKYASQEILSKILGQAFFNELRTKQQTAYLVGQVSEESYNMLLNLFAIESHNYLARDLLARTELFIQQQVENLSQRKYTEEMFQGIQQALIAELQAPPENMKEMGKELFTLILQHQADFDWKQKRIDAMSAISYDDFIKLSTDLLSRQNRRRLAILIKGNLGKEDVNYTRLKNPEWFRDNGSYE